MDRSAMEGIASRLAMVEGLYFPGAYSGGAPPDSDRRRSDLVDLLSRDAPIFLERYGSQLTTEELQSFDILRSDYEVGWHLEKVRMSREPTAEEARAKATAIRNRRRSYMERLVRTGEYFSEDAMRERDPYLHHEYVGKFQDPLGRGMARPGERWSDTLMRRWEEAVLVEKIRGEQKRQGVPKQEWVGGGQDSEEEEEEEEQEEEEEEEQEEESKEVEMEARPEKIEKGAAQEKVEGNQEPDAAHSTDARPQEPELTAEEMQDKLDEFRHIMQQKFLAGEDSEYLDYSKIDNDERLDDHWLREANFDAEEKYFDEE